MVKVKVASGAAEKKDVKEWVEGLSSSLEGLFGIRNYSFEMVSARSSGDILQETLAV